MPELPKPGQRYRCSACGNLTRFDVTVTMCSREYQHFSINGEMRVDESEVLSQRVDQVTCRWCGHGRGIEVIDSLSGSSQPT